MNHIETLEQALVMICVKCRSNEWGPDTPRKEILSWFHDTAAAALEGAEKQDDNDFPLGKACDLSGEGACEACQ
jgi:hypothetical protein